ncbi:PEP-CTERM sorting domain-containing protein [Rubritalea tangerina]|uniref:PEP-CTERM sorting domain-containing protein n=1 Tax=Rubritalea tangerina TaxID=430798 RepID=UPI00362009CF
MEWRHSGLCETWAVLGYTLVAYLASDPANGGGDTQLGEYWVQDQQADAGATILSNGGSKTTPILLGNSYTGSYVEAVGSTAGNYLVYSGLTASDVTIRANKQGGRSSIAGFQIVTVPEPSSMSLLALGAISLVLKRRR